MSNRPHPVAVTACMLMERVPRAENTSNHGQEHSAYTMAQLASELHRLAPACDRQAVAECNGELWDGQRDRINRMPLGHDAIQAIWDLDDVVANNGKRLDKRLAKLNEQLAPFALCAGRHHDPRSSTLRLYSTDKSRPIASNCGDGESWAIVGKGG